MARDLNTCKTLGDFIEAAIGIYEDSGKTLTVEHNTFVWRHTDYGEALDQYIYR